MAGTHRGFNHFIHLYLKAANSGEPFVAGRMADRELHLPCLRHTSLEFGSSRSQVGVSSQHLQEQRSLIKKHERHTTRSARMQTDAGAHVHVHNRSSSSSSSDRETFTNWLLGLNIASVHNYFSLSLGPLHCRSPANAVSMPSNSGAVSVFRQPRKSLSAAKSQLFPRRSAGLFVPVIIPIQPIYRGKLK